MRYDQVIRARAAADQHVQRLDEIRVPDAWHAIMVARDQVEGTEARSFTARDVEALLETWHLCHDLLNHLKRVNVEPNTP